MIIQHNIMSMYTNRQLGMNRQKEARASERLASGYKINKAADNAAGLSISEKMRAQIRGLDQGERNIMDGISLVDTAEGALQEIHNILHRVRELTVQAYNDTYVEEDRDAIQLEVEQCLKEIDHIAETTEFNTRPLLKGNPTRTITISDDMTMECMTTMRLTKKPPEWLKSKMDLTMEERSSYTLPQDTSGVMLIYDGVNESSKKYCGPLDADIDESYKTPGSHQGSWSGTIDNNPSAKLDYSGLLSANTGQDLYKNLFELIGTKIAYPCGTCSDYVNGISFGGEESCLETLSFEGMAEIDVSGELNLSTTSFPPYTGYFAAVQDVINNFANNYTGTPSAPDLDLEKAAVQELAKRIAHDLRDKTLDILGQKMASHFNRVVAGDDDYSLYVYDYRDKDKLDIFATELAADTNVKIDSVVNYRISTTMLQPGETAEVEFPLIIECGAQGANIIPLDLYDMSLDTLNMDGYQINRYETTTYYSKEYQDKLRVWEESARQVTTTEKRMVKEIDTYQPPIYTTAYVNGEAVEKKISEEKITYKEVEKTFTRTTRIYGPKPQPQPGDIIEIKKYNPDSLQQVDGAMEYVSAARVSLGAKRNRLEHAYDYNTYASDNLQDAESRIRDADIADEMVEYSKHNILGQSAQSILAQANAASQNVMQLLQG